MQWVELERLGFNPVEVRFRAGVNAVLMATKPVLGKAGGSLQ